MKIHLVRHGETPLNAARVLQHPDTPLSERGIAQAARVAERLADAGIAAILTSDYARALATAEAIRAATGAPMEVEPLLRERNFGIYRGCAYHSLKVDINAPDHDAARGRERAGVRGAGRGRVGGGACRGGPRSAARSRWSRTVSSAARWRATTSRPAPGIDVATAKWVNACVTEIEVVPGPRWTIARLACAKHLDGLESLAPSSMRDG